MQEDEELVKYRQHIAESGEKAQEHFDKTVLTLAGGALGISITFVERFVGPAPLVDPHRLYYSWITWAASVSVVLVSYYCSVRALRSTLKASYSGKVYVKRPGGWWSIATEWLNILGAILFVVGLGLMIQFVGRNLRGMTKDSQPQNSRPAPAPRPEPKPIHEGYVPPPPPPAKTPAPKAPTK